MGYIMQEGPGTFEFYGWLPAPTRARLSQLRCKRRHKYGLRLHPTWGRNGINIIFCIIIYYYSFLYRKSSHII